MNFLHFSSNIQNKYTEVEETCDFIPGLTIKVKTSFIYETERTEQRESFQIWDLGFRKETGEHPSHFLRTEPTHCEPDFFGELDGVWPVSAERRVSDIRTRVWIRIAGECEDDWTPDGLPQILVQYVKGILNLPTRTCEWEFF